MGFARATRSRSLGPPRGVRFDDCHSLCSSCTCASPAFTGWFRPPSSYPENDRFGEEPRGFTARDPLRWAPDPGGGRCLRLDPDTRAEPLAYLSPPLAARPFGRDRREERSSPASPCPFVKRTEEERNQDASCRQLLSLRANPPPRRCPRDLGTHVPFAAPPSGSG